MHAVTATDARRTLPALIEHVSNTCEVVEITSKYGNAALMCAREYASLQETAYLLRSPANAARLLESLAQAKSTR